MRRKYLEDLGRKATDNPEGWSVNDNRQEFWKEQRETYGFDERETWSLDLSIMLLLYERLMMFNEITEGKTDKTFHEFQYREETLTLQECLDCMLDSLRYVLSSNEIENYDMFHIKKQEVFEILALCHSSLWW